MALYMDKTIIRTDIDDFSTGVSIFTIHLGLPSTWPNSGSLLMKGAIIKLEKYFGNSNKI